MPGPECSLLLAESLPMDLWRCRSAVLFIQLLATFPTRTSTWALVHVVCVLRWGDWLWCAVALEACLGPAHTTTRKNV